MNKDKYHHKRNFKLSVIITLCIFIIFFYFFSSINFKNKKKILIEKPLIFLDDIEQTVQRTKQKETFEANPESSKVLLSSETNEINALKDVLLTLEVAHTKPSGENIHIVPPKEKIHISPFSENTHIELSQNLNNELNKSQNVNFIPRQIFEVIPKESDDVSGIIKLSLKINAEGKVTAHKILTNTTKSDGCLNDVIAAAYKSKWEPLKFKSGVKEYWVEKSYSFN